MLPFQNRALDRRTFLRGAGACVALPWLEAMQPALARPHALPLRALFVFAPNGQKMDDWTPTQAGRTFALPFLLEPLAPVRERVTVFTGLAIDAGRAHGDGFGDHARAGASFLTCAHPKKTGGADIHVGVSVDQVLATQIGGAATFASLEVGMERGSPSGSCDSGYACAYSNNIAWRDAHTPVAKEHDPRAVFARLFGDPDQARDFAAAERERAATRSVLDAVLADTKALQNRVGGADRQKLDQYLTAVRELEQRLQRVASPNDGTPAPPAGVLAARTFADKLAAMYELLALAFATDRTRIATFMLGNAGSNRGYDFLGVPDGHHDLSHHGKKAEKLAGIRKINRFHTEAFAVFLQRLAGHREGDGDLLDQSLCVYGSGIGDGDHHNHDNLPVLVCGGGGGAHRGGAHVRFGKETPMANLYLAVLQAFGGRDERFADSSSPLALR